MAIEINIPKPEYTPEEIGAENVVNKKTTLEENSDTFYPTQKAVKTAVDAKQDNLGYTPENSANKATTVTGNETSNEKFGTIKAIVDYVGSAVTWIATNGANVLAHLTNTSNPHSVTATQADALKRDGSNANSDVDLGNYSLNSKSLNVKGTSGNGHIGLKHQSADATASGSETVIFAGSDGEPRYKNDGGTVAQFASRAWVTAQGFITNVITALGYTPENVSNKSDSYTASSSTTYASTKALVDGLATKQDITIVVSSNTTAQNDRMYHVIGNVTFTDPTGIEGRGYFVIVRFGSCVLGGNSYIGGETIHRIFYSGSWLNIALRPSTYVPTTRTINGYDLSANRTLTASDVSAVASNSAITGETKTKITYDSKGLVTSGADATTADIADSINKRYVTDAQLTVIGNTSNTNTGDETQATIISKLGYTPQAQFLSKLVFKEVYGGTTSSTSETILATFAFSANELPNQTTLYFETLAYKTAAIVNGSFRIRVNTSNTLVGATQLAQWGMGGNTSLHSQARRRFGLTGGNIYAYPASVTQNTDIITSTSAETVVAADVTNALYFFITFTANSSADTLNHVYSLMKNF